MTYTIVFKKSKKNDYINLKTYRLIVLLNTIRKILKTVISNRIKYITKTYDLLSDIQYETRTSQVIETVL